MPAPGQPFNLDELLGEEYVRHYLGFIEGGGRQFVVSDGSWVPPGSHPVPPLMDERETEGAHWEAEAVLREGTGPDMCSPSGELQLLPAWVWDVCGYYRRLGVPWTASRRELTRSYAALVGPGRMDDPDGSLAYALHQLLNPRIRRAYDLTPLGSLFLQDRPTQERLKAAAARRAARETAERGGPVGVDDVLGSWGLKRKEPQQGQEDVLQDLAGPHGGPGRQQAQGAPEVAPGAQEGYTLGGSPRLRWRLDWSWYERGECGQPPPWLEIWQSLLIGAFRDSKVYIPFGVGFCTSPDCDVLPPQAGRPLLCLLGTRPPTAEQAMRAVERVKAIASRQGASHARFRPWRRSS